ncbi:MAG TPA: branched-chain amino acid ABC transporter permease [Acidimicrobiia bacterium]|nr:branched-chain amino acid ABC transporter permease [Acidimicrobiia bacterium]
MSTPATETAPTTVESIATPLKGKPGRTSRIVALTIFMAVAILLPAWRDMGFYNYVLQIGAVVFMWIAMTSSWNILGGYTGYISLGHNVFFAVGGYVSGMLLLEFGWSPFATALLAGVVSLALGALAGLITYRTHGPSFIISTIALLLVVTLLMDNWAYLGGSNGLSLPLPPFEISWVKVPFYYGMLIAAALATILGYKVAHSKFGVALRAISEDEVKAEVSGIDTRKYKLMAFALSAFFPGVVGALWGYSLAYLRPVIFLLIAVAARMVLMAIVGGRGTVAGPVIGAMLVVFLDEASITFFGSSELNLAITGGLLVVMLLFFPLGIVGSLRDAGHLPAWLDWD